MLGVPKLKVTRERATVLALPALKFSPTGLSTLSIKYSRRKYLKVLLSFGHSEEAQFWFCIQKKPSSGCVLRKSPILGTKEKKPSFGC